MLNETQVLELLPRYYNICRRTGRYWANRIGRRSEDQHLENVGLEQAWKSLLEWNAESGRAMDTWVRHGIWMRVKGEAKTILRSARRKPTVPLPKATLSGEEVLGELDDQGRQEEFQAGLLLAEKLWCLPHYHRVRLQRLMEDKLQPREAKAIEKAVRELRLVVASDANLMRFDGAGVVDQVAKQVAPEKGPRFKKVVSGKRISWVDTAALA